MVPNYSQRYVIIVFKMITSSNLISFLGRFEFQYHNRNRYYKLALLKKLKFHALFCYQDIGNVVIYCLHNDDVIEFNSFWEVI